MSDSSDNTNSSSEEDNDMDMDDSDAGSDDDGSDNESDSDQESNVFEDTYYDAKDSRNNDEVDDAINKLSNLLFLMKEGDYYGEYW